jgi:phage gp46-like protein
MDIGLTLSPDGSGADIAIQDGAMVLDGTLQTAVLLSLLCNRVADADDIIPDGSTNRQGWWYDEFAPPLSDGTPDRWGSKLYLRLRSLLTQQTLLQLAADCEQALGWMITEGVAVDVEANAVAVSDSAAEVTVVISRLNNAGAPYTTSYKLVWDRTLGLAPSIQGPGFGNVTAVPATLSISTMLGPNAIVPPPGLIYTNGAQFGDADFGAGLIWNQATATLSVGSVAWGNLPSAARNFPLMMTVSGPPAPGVRYLFSIAEAYTIPADFAGCTTIQDVAATADAAFALSIIRGGVETGLGTVTLLPAGGTASTLSTQAAYATQPGDALVLTTPDTADATLSGFGISLLLQRI